MPSGRVPVQYIGGGGLDLFVVLVSVSAQITELLRSILLCDYDAELGQVSRRNPIDATQPDATRLVVAR